MRAGDPFKEIKMPQRDSLGVNEQLLNKLRMRDPNWNLNYTGRDGTDPVFDSGGEDYLSYIKGTGAGRDTPTPVVHSPYESPEAQPLYDPSMLGYSPAEVLRFKQGGVQGLPAYMLKERVYSPATSLGGDDPISTYLNAMQTPTGGEGGKAAKVLTGMGWSGGGNGLEFTGAPGGTTDAFQTFTDKPEGASPQWGDPEQQRFASDFLKRKWGVDDGTELTNPKKTMNMVSSLASIAAPIIGVSGALPAAGAAAAGEASTAAAAPATSEGLLMGADLGYSASQLAPGGMEALTPMAGEAVRGAGGLTGIEEAGMTPSQALTSANYEPLPNAAYEQFSGPMKGGGGLTGVNESAVYNPVGKTPTDALYDKAKSTGRNLAVKQVAKAFAPAPEQMEASGGAAETGEAAAPVPHVESGYYNRFTGERLSPEEFFRVHGRAQSMR